MIENDAINEGKSSRRAFSQAVEDYIKVIYKLQRTGGLVSTNDIAKSMGTSAASVTKMSKHLAEHRLLTHELYYGVRLTPVGEKIALETIRHHRLIELYLVQSLGYGWDEVDAEAERLEHHISEDFEERIDQILGHPRTDPHGDPIPTRDGIIESLYDTPLDSAEPGKKLSVRRVSDDSPEALRKLAQLGIRLGSDLEIQLRDPSVGIIQVTVDGTVQTMESRLAERVFVQLEADTLDTKSVQI